jgi:pimeloyl-ACP methyl ester carboxylesterase
MKKYNKFYLSLAFMSLAMGCQRLDDFLYAPKTLTEYRLNDIDKEFLWIDTNYFLADQDIHPLVLQSYDKNNKTQNIYAFYLGDTNTISQDTVILYCHGNAFNIDVYWQRATLLANLGAKKRVGVLIFDYQGFGKSQGTPHEQSLYNDRETCLAWLKSKGLSSQKLIIYGFSLGTAPATRACARPSVLVPSKLILEAPFASAAQLTSDATPLSLPGSYTNNLYIDNAEEIKTIKQPFLWLHGESDTYLSRKKHGQIVYDNYGGTKKQLHIEPTAGHGDLPNVMGAKPYIDLLSKFVFED